MAALHIGWVTGIEREGRRDVWIRLEREERDGLGKCK